MPGSSAQTAQNVVGRLSLYRRLLTNHLAPGTVHIYSHELAHLACVSAAQVRRDLMSIDFQGSPSKGYRVEELLHAINLMLDSDEGDPVALIGIGNLGRALMTYFHGRREKLAITAAFDRDPKKVNRLLHGCRCYPVESLESVVKRESIRIAILAVPASEAQTMTEALVRAGIRGIMNFAPVPLRLPPGVFLEDLDMTMALERVAYFARQGSRNERKSP